MARKVKPQPSKPETSDDLQELEHTGDTYSILERMADMSQQSNRGYIIVSLPAAHTQGLDNSQS